MHDQLQLIERIFRRSKATAAVRALLKTPDGRRLVAAIGREMSQVITVVRDGREVVVITVIPGASGARVTSIRPGRYQLVQSTGRVLWDREVATHEVIRSASEPLRAAAQTADFPPDQSICETGADKSLVVTLYRGTESGTLLCRFSS